MTYFNTALLRRDIEAEDRRHVCFYAVYTMSLLAPELIASNVDVLMPLLATPFKYSAIQAIEVLGGEALSTLDLGRWVVPLLTSKNREIRHMTSKILAAARAHGADV